MLAVTVISIMVFSFLVSSLFFAIGQSGFGIRFIYHFTGGHPEISIIILGCVLSFFAVEWVSEKLSLERETRWAAKVLMVITVVFAGYNLITLSIYDALKNAVVILYLYLVHRMA